MYQILHTPLVKLKGIISNINDFTCVIFAHMYRDTYFDLYLRTVKVYVAMYAHVIESGNLPGENTLSC